MTHFYRILNKFQAPLSKHWHWVFKHSEFPRSVSSTLSNTYFSALHPSPFQYPLNSFSYHLSSWIMSVTSARNIIPLTHKLFFQKQSLYIPAGLCCLLTLSHGLQPMKGGRVDTDKQALSCNVVHLFHMVSLHDTQGRWPILQQMKKGQMNLGITIRRFIRYWGSSMEMSACSKISFCLYYSVSLT